MWTDRQFAKVSLIIFINIFSLATALWKYSCTCITLKIFLYFYYDGNIPVLILWRKYSCSCIMIEIFLYLYYVYLAMHESPIISILLLGHAYFWPITVGALTIIHLRDSTQNIRKRFKIRIHFYQKHPPTNSKKN